MRNKTIATWLFCFVCASTFADEFPTEGFTRKAMHAEEVRLVELLFNRGMEDYKKQLYPEAYRHFLSGSEYGHVESIAMLSVLYYMGKGVEKNYVKAAEMAKIAAYHRSVIGTSFLGLCYQEGAGLIQDHTAAYFWLSVSHHFQNKDTPRKTLADAIEKSKRLVPAIDRHIADEQIIKWIKGEIRDQNIKEAKAEWLNGLSAKYREQAANTSGSSSSNNNHGNADLSDIRAYQEQLLFEMKKHRENQYQRDLDQQIRDSDAYARELLLREINDRLDGR
jgi:hypothetical protein